MGEQCDQIMRWFSQDSFSDCSNPRLCRLLLCIIPSPYIFPNPRHSHHTGSSAHLGVPCLCPSIFDCHTRSFAHLGVARLHPSILITHPDSLSLPVAFLLHGHLPTDPPPPFSFPGVFQVGLQFFSSPLGATTLSFSDPLLHIVSPLHISPIRYVAPLTALQLPAIALCKFYPTEFALPLVCLLSPESPMSHLINSSLSSL